ncbi:oxidoreductase, partial [Salmonella enterica subsp. enterica]|nr:oxidoreductase [Salmonella enterica subsp. enterica]
TRSELDRYGKAKKIEFSISFQRCDEDMRERFQSASAGELLNTLKDKMATAAF